MSRAKSVAARAALDSYQTPLPLAREIVGTLAARLRLTCPEVLEPSAGSGAFVRAARDEWPAAHITAVDVDPRAEAACREAGATITFTRDWVDLAAQIAAGQDETRPPKLLILGNPPYREAEEHVRAAMRVLLPREHLAFLLRINLLGSRSRVAFWREAPPLWIAPIVPRPSFTGGGSDATEYALFCWKGGFRGAPRVVRPIEWTKPTRRAA